MIKLNSNDIERINYWLFQNGRELDMARYNVLFLSEEKDLVLQGVTLFETDNGAFGKGIEPDNQNQEANVLSTSVAFEILQEVGYKYDPDDELFNEILGTSLKYLFNQAPMQDDKWCVIEKSNNKYPCGEWWKYTDEQHSCLPFYPTPALLGQILLFTSSDSKYYDRVNKALNKILIQYINYESPTKYDLHSIYLLLKALKTIDYDNPLVEQTHSKWLTDLDYMVTRDENKFSSFESTMMYEIVDEDSLLNGRFKDEIEKHAQYLINSRTSTGLWIPNWNWGNDDSYWDMASILWASALVIRNLKFLNNFGYIEEDAFDD
ncbi:MAG: hypothetical protein HUJ61_07465 [Bacilli bacterium]|nr:hypothetical protein [Bacilli bacterium]